MLQEIVNTILFSAQNAFLQVGVFVGIMMLIFGSVRFWTAGEIIRKIEKYRAYQPLFGAILGVSPGCGGAIFMMPLYTKGVVTFGTIIATLIATMGDSSFVIISRMPAQALYIHAISFVVGVVSGYVVDYFNLDILRKQIPVERLAVLQPVCDCPVKPELTSEHGHIISKSRINWDETSLGHKLTHHGYMVWWAITSIGFILGVTLLTQRSMNDVLGFNIDMFIGVIGTAFSLVIWIMGKRFIGDDTLDDLRDQLSSFKETLVHSGMETAFVTTWVFIAYLAYELFMLFSGLDLQPIVDQAGVWSVIVAAAIGLIPGCGPQIVLVTLYTNGIIPFSAVLANAISQDGDALFPILAMDKKAGLVVTFYTTIPAIILGILFYFLLQI